MKHLCHPTNSFSHSTGGLGGLGGLGGNFGGMGGMGVMGGGGGSSGKLKFLFAFAYIFFEIIIISRFILCSFFKNIIY